MQGMLASDPEAVKKPGPVSTHMSSPQIARWTAAWYTRFRIRERGTQDDREIGERRYGSVRICGAGIRGCPLDATGGIEEAQSLHVDFGAGGHALACRRNETGASRALQQLRLQPPVQDAGRR